MLWGQWASRSALAWWSSATGRPKTARLPPTSLRADQPGVAVQGGVLDPLGHGRAAELLETADRLGRGRLQQQGRDQAVEPRRPGRVQGRAGGGGRLPDHHPVGGGDHVGHIGPVDGQAGGQLDHRGPVGRLVAGQVPGHPGDLGAEVALQPLPLGRQGHGGRVGVGAGEVAVALGEGAGGGRVDQDPVGHGQELVAGGAGDRPAGQALAVLQDLLDDHVRHPGGQPLAGRRPGRPGRRCGRPGPRRPGPRRPAGGWWRG